MQTPDTEAIDESAGGDDAEEAIPEAKQGGEAEALRAERDHT
jgi:hypothetical protein